MKKLLLVVLATALAVAGSLSIIAWRYDARVQRNSVVGIVPVGGLTPADAQKKLRLWWETQRIKTLVLKNDLFGSKTPEVKLSQLGITLDDKASVAQLPTEDFWDNAKTVVQSEAPPVKKYDLVLTGADKALKKLKHMVDAAAGKRRPAVVKYEGGVFTREPEVSGYTLDDAKALAAISDALVQDKAVDVPLVQAPKKVSDDDLAKITEVVSEFSTRFPRRKVSRNSNIRTAAGKLNGVVLAPGERLSFNETVGERTIDNGFKIAGVYKNGKHDLGVGGGICQVSSTLYNAVLMSNLKVLKRHNHSMPVAYLPVGRDATVNYGALDLVFENTMSTPIAISSSYSPGRLTFRVLGKKDPSISVKILAVGHKSWDTGVQTIKDPKLAAGKRTIVEKGSRGHSVTTYRLVFKNGVQIKREYLGHSYYKGGVRIVAVGTRAPKNRPLAPSAPTAPQSGVIPASDVPRRP